MDRSVPYFLGPPPVPRFVASASARSDARTGSGRLGRSERMRWMAGSAEAYGGLDEGTDWGAGLHGVDAISVGGKIVVEPGAGMLAPSLVVQIHPG